MQGIFRILSAVVSLYTLLCFIRIMLTWFPGASYSPVGRFFSQMCDPFLNLFRGIKFLRMGAFDFSPALALCALWGLSYIFTTLEKGVVPSVGGILALIVSLCWNVISSLLGFLLILVLIRLVVLLFSGNYSSYGSIWDQIDRAISPILFRATSIFSGGKPMSYKMTLIIALVELILIRFGGRFLIAVICSLLNSIPF